MKHNHTTWVEVSQKALTHNIKEFQRILTPQTEIMAVVKSNAYGHGMVQSAKIFKQAGCQWIGTVNLEEALELRKNNITGPILVLSYFHPDKLAEAIKQNISLTVYHLTAVRTISRLAEKLNKTAAIHFKLDTGTSRLGVQADQSLDSIKKIKALPHLNLEGIFSHLADAEKPNQNFTRRQINIFEKIITQCQKEGITFPIKHIACSAAAILNKESYFNLVRIGISSYGLWSVENNGTYRPGIKLQPALSWHTRIIQIKTIAKGQTIGYGRTYKVKKEMRIALLPIGYWEGFDRKLSNNGEVIIGGKLCNIRGRICMNLTMVDVSNCKNVKVGDRATLIGTQNNSRITAEDLARRIGTINYEVVTRINPLIPRIYV